MTNPIEKSGTSTRAVTIGAANLKTLLDIASRYDDWDAVFARLETGAPNGAPGVLPDFGTDEGDSFTFRMSGPNLSVPYPIHTHEASVSFTLAGVDNE